MKKVESQTRRVRIPEGHFHIDVSNPEPYVVQTNRGSRVALESLTPADIRKLTTRATRQLLRSMHDDPDAVDEHRATLYFLSRWKTRLPASDRLTEERSAAVRRKETVARSFTRRSA